MPLHKNSRVWLKMSEGTFLTFIIFLYLRSLEYR